MLPNLRSWWSSIHITMVRLPRSQSASSLKVDCIPRSSNVLVIRWFSDFLWWWISVGYIMRIVGPVLLTIKALVWIKGRINIVGSCIVLQLTKGNIWFHMRKSLVRERHLLQSSVSNVTSWATMLMSAAIMLWGALNMERQVTVFHIARVLGGLVITVPSSVTSVQIVRN